MEQYDNFKSAMISRDEPIMFNISTAGKGSSSVGMRVYQEAKAVTKNDDDDSNFAMIWEPNKNYEWSDRSVWEMVNPNIGVSVTIEQMEASFIKATRSAHAKAEFLTKHLDVFVNGADNFFERDQVEHVLVSSEELGDLAGEACYLGLDLSKTTDLTCVNLNFPTWDANGKALLKVKQMYFIPSEDIDLREQEDNVPYRDLCDKGFVMLCDGKFIDQDMVFEYITECMNTYEVQMLNYDPAMSALLIEKIENLGLECNAVSQYPNVMNAPIDDMERIIYKKQLITDNPLFIYCVLNLVVGVNLQGMKAASKAKSKKKIDGVVAFLVAHKETMLQMEVVSEEGMDDLISEIYK